MKSLEGGENLGKKMISDRRNKDTHLQYHRGYKIQRDSIPKIGTKASKRKRIGKHQLSGRKSHRWCVLHTGVLEIHPVGDRVISILCVQHQGGRCSPSED